MGQMEAVLRFYPVPGTVLDTVPFSYLFFIRTLKSRFHAHFTDEKTEA